MSSISIDNSKTTRFAVYVSVIIAIILGFNLIIGVVYGITYIYLSVVAYVHHVNSYSSIEHKEDDNSSMPIMVDSGAASAILGKGDK